MIRHILPAAGLIALLAAPARADEAYVCDAGRIVYVKPGELEALKRTDTCIAGYYGLTVAAPAKPDTGKPESAKKATAKTPAVSPVPPGGAAKGLQIEREARAAAAKYTPVAVAVSKPMATPVAAAPSDFRNVFILNASPGAERVFRHDK